MSAYVVKDDAITVATGVEMFVTVETAATFTF